MGEMSAVDRINPQRTKCHKFAMGVEDNARGASKLNGSAGEETREVGTIRASFHDFPGNTTGVIHVHVVLQFNVDLNKNCSFSDRV